MNTFTLTQKQMSGRFFAVLTAISLLMSAFPVGLPVAAAAETLHGPDAENITMVGGEYASGVIDATDYENLEFSFDFDSTKLDGSNDSFTYGWRSAGSDNDLGTVDGLTNEPPAEVDSIAVPLPPTAAVADLEVYVYVTADPGNGSDQVKLTNIMVSGDRSMTESVPAPEGTLNESENPYDTPMGKIRICHYDSELDAYPNPNQQVNLQSIVDETGHGAHVDDIIPPFWYQFAEDDPVSLYTGQNWNATGTTIYNNDCVVPTEEPPAESGSLEITDPESDGQTLSGSHAFEAEYYDEDDDADNIAWAIREGIDEECSAGATLAGNVSGFSDPSTFTDPTWTATVDMSTWADGEYCLAVNPEEGAGSDDYRAVRHFLLEHETPEEPEICSYGGEVISYTDPAYQNDGDEVEADRRLVGAVATGVAPYANFFGKEEDAWEVDPFDFFSLGIEGELVYKFTDKVAVDQPGADLAIWETTGGPADEQSAETVEVLVSQDGVTYTSLGTVTGDGTVDIGPAGLDFVQYVKLIDQSAGVQGDDGDGYDLDAITIIDGSCEEPQEPADECLIEGYKYTESGDPLEHWIIGLAKRLSVEWQNEVQYTAPWLVGFDKTDETGYYCIEEFKYDGDWNHDYSTMNHQTAIPSPVTSDDVLPVPEKHHYVFEVLPEGWEALWVDVDESGTTSPSSDSFFDVFVEVDLDDNEQVDFYNTLEEEEEPTILGCTDEEALNYDPEATEDDGSCEYEQLVCEPEVNLLTNGGFETPTVEHAAEWNIFPQGTTGLAWLVDWVAPDDAPEVASLELHGGVNDWMPSEGSQYAELDGDYQGPGGASGEPASTQISQQIDTIPGAEYRLTWDFSPRPGEGQPENRLDVLVGGSVIATNAGDGTGNSNTDWSNDSVLFTATGSQTMIGFTDNGEPNSRGTFLDNAGLYCVSEPQPEPGCTLEVLSDTNTLVVEENDYAVETYVHDNWTDDIDDATWVWATDFVENPDQNETYTFEETFTVDSPASALLDIAADNHYKVFVNGSLVLDRSAVENNFADHAIMEDVDILSELNPSGENTLRIEVTNKAIENSTQLQNPAGVLYRLDIEGAARCEVTTEPASDPEPEPEPEPDPEPEDTRLRPDRDNNTDASATRLRRPSPEPLVAGAATDQCGMYLYDYLQQGGDNDSLEVRKLQAFLNGQGYMVPMTGIFGEATDRAVRAFQAEHRDDVLTPWMEAGYVPHDNPTGWVYQLTRWKINNIVCPGSEPLPNLIP